MSVFLASDYAGWRASAGGPWFFHEDGAPGREEGSAEAALDPPGAGGGVEDQAGPGAGPLELPERLMQAIWWHQRVRREELVTVDGRPLRVLHPGFWNREPGPDFRGAMLQFGGESPVTGDVEVDLIGRGWRDHAHDVNPAYRDVILHVVWRRPSGGDLGVGPGRPGGPGRCRAVLSLAEVLDAPLDQLAASLAGEAGGEFPELWRGHCCAPLRQVPAERVRELLRQAAAVRFRAKAARFAARARQAGWEQALWEGLFRGLGYKHNVWPMHRVAELLPALRGSGPDDRSANVEAVLMWQARLLGVAGLLPRDLPRRSAGGTERVRAWWDLWWRQRAELEDVILPRALWQFGGLRPSNRPERRLGLAAHWLADGGLPAALETWCNRMVPDAELAASLAEILRPGRDEYWSWHWTLGGPRLRQPQPLLGGPRLTDLAVNVILPWLWARAWEGSSESLRAGLEHRYFAWPASEDNAVLRLARQRLFGSPSQRLLRSAATQQGLMQIVRDFCDGSNALCSGCPFPEFVRQWQPQ